MSFAQILPMAFVMIAGPQISTSFFRGGGREERHHARYAADTKLVTETAAPPM